MIAEGEAAPDFELVSDSGERVRLSLLRGRPVVLYFYPRDDTPGCRGTYGRTSMGIERSTFVVRADGTIARPMLGIRPAGHAAQALDSLPD